MWLVLTGRIAILSEAVQVDDPKRKTWRTAGAEADAPCAGQNSQVEAVHLWTEEAIVPRRCPLD